MLDFLRCVMDLRSTTSNISETEEEGDAVDTQPAQEEDVGVTKQGPEENQSSQSTATATLDRQRVPIRSVGATTPRARKRHGHPKRDMDAAMLGFMEEMRATRRADTTDPFSDPNNQDASFARNLYHHLVRVPNERKMDVQMSIFNFTGVCIRAAMSGEPMPPVITHHQRPYHGEQAPQHSFHPYHPGINPHHQRAPAHTGQNVVPPPQVAPTYESSSSQGTSYSHSSQSSTPYSTSHSPYYQDL
ncbi:uncharacterized protein [Aquarana catesbeiana]|uniref:uncharacterized protein n=1 Tax=Aquarana catesbeiana TaxID=8400 RepID=UPI003CC93C3D